MNRSELCETITFEERMKRFSCRRNGINQYTLYTGTQIKQLVDQEVASSVHLQQVVYNV